MDLKKFAAQIELMHQEALRKSAEYEDKWLNTFHGDVRAHLLVY
ncbi:hypothetical protein A5802_002025 [Enterococcus mundtii]|uniref:Uncharacterized protein n=1 Tax=Enterococcus mundtii TaxID=53346 RepID=A0A242L261_ENTMU|nr:hypothetical protein A5802_002025 [Enterococcus mundtii]